MPLLLAANDPTVVAWSRLSATRRATYLALAAAELEAEDYGEALSPDYADRLEGDWRQWVRQLFPQYVRRPDGQEVNFGERHERLWDWVWDLVPGMRPPPFVAVWPRGGAKSTTVELGISSVAARQQRKYGLYVCSTQERADDHVGNVGSMLEATLFGQVYPEAGDRAISKYGQSKGWRRNRLRTGSGFTLDAMGLDVAARGAKIEEARPDFMIFDDIDETDEGVALVEKKIRTITQKILPARSPDCAFLFVQNLVSPHGVFARLTTDNPDLQANWLVDRIVSGPYPSINDFEYETRWDDDLRRNRTFIIGGVPTWEGQDLTVCQEEIDSIGISAFQIEHQHEVEGTTGGMWENHEFVYCNVDELPNLDMTVVFVDPAVTETDKSDSMGIQADSYCAATDRIYRRFSWERISSPLVAIKLAITTAVRLRASVVGVETDQGGDAWQVVYDTAWRELLEAGDIPAKTPKPKFVEDKAGRGYGSKVWRASTMHAEYELGRFVHVRNDSHSILEKGLRRFPVRKPFDIVDAAYWSSKYLLDHRRKLLALPQSTRQPNIWRSVNGRS